MKKLSSQFFLPQIDSPAGTTPEQQPRSTTLYFSGLAFSGRERSGVDGDGYADGFTQHTHSPS
ncbi:hypothetical protein L9G16_20150, partial [Shewanella sp. A25]|nr:hypothetical protein [Shewanella shenzhenensis]